MALAKVLARGQITLPREVRKAANIKPGDTVIVHTTGPGKVQIEVLPRMSLSETFEKWRIEGPVDLDADREAMYDELAREVFQTMAENTPDFKPPDV